MPPLRTPATRIPVPKILTAALVAAALSATACSGQTSGGPVVDRAAVQPAPAQQGGVPTSGNKVPSAAETPGASSTVSSNPDVSADQDPLSTFALDVDTGSFTRSRAMLRANHKPMPAEVRTEEFVNYFDQGYRPPADGLSVQLDGTAVPVLESPQTRVVRVGIQSAVTDQRNRPQANLTFVIDVSGSMGEPNKLDAVKEALHKLVGSLQPDDTVTIVVYSDRTRTVLEQTPLSEASRINGVIDDLRTEGSTNAEAGLKLGYEKAEKQRREGALNRVVLLSDGVANVGNSLPEPILNTIGKGAQQRIDLVTVGFGLEEFNDPLMEQLADKGNGFFAYVDSQREASRLFSQNLTGTLVVTARQAKAQVAFDPAQVATYRLLGYENRAIADSDFRNDKVDGGEIGSGHSVTALYEVRLKPGAAESTTNPFVRATVRYLQPSDQRPVERVAELTTTNCSPEPKAAAPHLQQDVVVAEFSESLRGGPWASRRTPKQIAEEAKLVQQRLPGEQLDQLAELTAKAA